jgi:hypothetical protein
LFLAAAIIGVEALVAVVFGVMSIAQVDARRLVVGSGVAVLMLAYGAFLAAIARGVARGARWSRGAALATQLLLGLLGTSFLDGETSWIGVGLLVAAVVAGVCVLVPAATAVFTAGEDQS